MNCFLIYITEGKTEGKIKVMGRRGRRSKLLMDDRKERRGYCILKQEARDCDLWIARCRRGYGPVVRQTTE